MAKFLSIILFLSSFISLALCILTYFGKVSGDIYEYGAWFFGLMVIACFFDSLIPFNDR
jgi:hypothetical protein